MPYIRTGRRRNRFTKRRIPNYTPCGYCFDEWATCWDHIVPLSYQGNSSVNNLMPACERCNVLAADKVFDNIEEKRKYIVSQLKQARAKPRLDEDDPPDHD